MSRPTLKLPAKPAGDSPARTPGRKPVRGGPGKPANPGKSFAGAPAKTAGPRNPGKSYGDARPPRSTTAPTTAAGDRPFRSQRSDRPDSRPPATGAPRAEYLPNGGKPRVRRDDDQAGRPPRADRGERPATDRPAYGGPRPEYQPGGDKSRYQRDAGRGPERSPRSDRPAAPSAPARPEYQPGGRYRRDHDASSPAAQVERTPDAPRPEYLPNGGKPRYRGNEGGGERSAKPGYGYPPRGEAPRRSADGRPAAPRRDGERPAYGASAGYANKPRPAPSGDRRPAYGSRPASPARIAPLTTEEGVASPAAKRPGNDLPRLSKLMSEQGLCSRREADEWIENGWVKVDGEVVDTLGTRVSPKAKIEIAPAAAQHQSESVTILLHKPIGYVSGQAEDGYEPAFVLVRPENRWEEDRSSRPLKQGHLRGLAPAGRLDIDSTGLLVLTQDGRVARRLVGDDSKVEKEYLVRVEGTLDEDGMKLLNHGLSLDGVKLKPAHVSWQNEEQLRFVLREGKKRQIRRMCEMVGLHVVGLKRIRIGSVALGKLPVGTWRFLRSDEKF